MFNSVDTSIIKRADEAGFYSFVKELQVYYAVFALMLIDLGLHDLMNFLVCVQKQCTMVFLTAESRPKQLLVYINPYGGKRQGKRIYEQKVAPLFSLASISTDVVSE